MPDDLVPQVAVLRHVLLNTTINGTEYLLESRVVKLKGESSRTEYRVLLGETVIKDWTEGNIDQHFISGK